MTKGNQWFPFFFFEATAGMNCLTKVNTRELSNEAKVNVLRELCNLIEGGFRRR